MKRIILHTGLLVLTQLIAMPVSADTIGEVGLSDLQGPSSSFILPSGSLFETFKKADACIAKTFRGCKTGDECEDDAIYSACQNAVIMSRAAFNERVRRMRILSKPVKPTLVAAAEFCIQSPTGRLYESLNSAAASEDVKFLNNEFGPSDSGRRWYVVDCGPN